MLEELSPRAEISGIDEAFCDLQVYNCRGRIDFAEKFCAMGANVPILLLVGIAPDQNAGCLPIMRQKWQRHFGRVDLLERQRKITRLLPVDEVWD